MRTQSRLLVHLRRELVPVDAGCIVPYLQGSVARDVLWMYRAFGLLQDRYVVVHRRRGIGFRFDEKHPLVPYIRDVLTALARVMPQCRVREERQRTEPVPKRPDSHRGRRKPSRWKW